MLSLHIRNQNHSYLQNETVCKLRITNYNHCSTSKTNHLTYLLVETRATFQTLTPLHKHLINKISLQYLQINIYCSLVFYSHSLINL